MKNILHTLSLTFLVAAGLVALARYLHPATFSPNILTLLLVAFAICAVIALWKMSDEN